MISKINISVKKELREYLTYNSAGAYIPFEWYEKCFTGSDIQKEHCELQDGHFIIPEGYYFVLGDNRNNSSDSRVKMVGNIHEDDIIGRAWLRIWPFNRFGVLKHQ